MASVTEGTILRVVASLLFPDDVIMQNVFHVVLTSVVGDNDASDVVTDLVEYVEDIYTELNALISADVDASDIKVYEYDSVDDDWDEIGTDAWSDTFAGTGHKLPHGAAGLILLRTLDPDVTGKKFFGGFVVGVMNGTSLGAGQLADLALAAAEIVSSFVATTTSNVYTPGVWSVAQNNFRAFNGSYTVNAVPGYQRRRKPGVGI